MFSEKTKTKKKNDLWQILSIEKLIEKIDRLSPVVKCVNKFKK